MGIIKEIKLAILMKMLKLIKKTENRLKLNLFQCNEPESKANIVISNGNQNDDIKIEFENENNDYF